VALSRESLAAVLLAAAAPVAWATNVIASRVLVSEGVDPLTLTAARWLLAAALMLAYSFARGERVPLGLGVLAAGLLGITLFNNLLYFALRYAPAAIVGVVFGLVPLSTMLLARLLGMERLDPVLVAAGLLGFAGVAALEYGSMEPGSGLQWLGVLLALAAVLVCALYTLASKKLMRGLSPLSALTGSTLLSTPFNLAFAAPSLLGGGLSTLLEPHSLALLLYIAAVPGFLAYLAWFHAVNRLGAGPTSVFVNLLPVATLLLAVTLLGESMNMMQAAGTALVFAALALTTRRQLALLAHAPARQQRHGAGGE
jgi:drug/metabolite transporter (DMT)-like permease